MCEINMTATVDFSESEIIFNRASQALAKSQNLIASWLPPKSHEVAASKTEGELDEEESDICSSVPERYDSSLVDRRSVQWLIWSDSALELLFRNLKRDIGVAAYISLPTWRTSCVNNY